MFVPKRFAEADLSALDWLVAHDAFATLVTVDGGEAFASHIPVGYRRDGDQVEFHGHVARANPQWRHAGDGGALLILHGPHAYVSPSWYPDPADSVPTWNYAVAHVYGRLETTDDPQQLAAIVAGLAAHYEEGIGSDWRFPGSAPGTVRELAAIVGFRLAADRVQIKYKLSQHHPEAKRRAAAEALARQPQADARTIAALMQARLPQAAPTLETE